MSKLSTRIVLSVVLGLLLIAGVLMTYRVASANIGGKSMGMYVLSGGLVNQLQSQSPSETNDQNQVVPFPGSSGEGGQGGCESEKNINPSDL
jgi:hypothetical protein